MEDIDPLHYQWRVTVLYAGGKRRSTMLRVKMTQAQALDYAAANPGKVLELQPGTGEQRTTAGYMHLRPSGGAMKTPGLGD
jgi:hypothetical protein